MYLPGMQAQGHLPVYALYGFFFVVWFFFFFFFFVCVCLS